MADIQAVISALDVFSRTPDKSQLERANTLLQDFQHSVNKDFLSFQPESSDSSPVSRLLL